MDEPTFQPYGFRPEIGDCADVIPYKNNAKEYWANHTSFRSAGKILIKHAP